MWRNINIPGLQPRTAYGQTGANQFLGQIETGYRVDLGGAPRYFVTPFALLQGSTANQKAFTETGAQSLNLNVAQQTTQSLRTVFGAAPTPDGVVIGFSASTAIANAMAIYVRYEGIIAGQDSSHALTVGLRASW